MPELTSLWQTTTRYYRISLIQDLFGVWVVIRQWGGVERRQYQEKTSSYTNYGDALVTYNNTKRRRLARGYEQVVF